MDIDRTLSNRDATKLFDYLDEKGSDDGVLRVGEAVSAIVKSGRRSASRHSRDYDDDKHVSSKGSRSPRTRRGGSSEGGAARVFRKQPYLLEELVRAIKKMESRGR